MRAIVEASGATFDDVVMLRVYLTKREDFPIMNDAYGAFVAQHTTKGVLPSRTTVFTGLPARRCSSRSTPSRSPTDPAARRRRLVAHRAGSPGSRVGPGA